MLEAIYLPKLNRLTPTLDSTLLKIMEEGGELARAVLKFLPYEGQLELATEAGKHSRLLLKEVAEELLDVAQTCVTMLFVMEEVHALQVDPLIANHLAKLKEKGYGFDEEGTYSITTSGNFKYLHLPRLEIDQVTLLTTVCKIQEELGELTQFLGKGAGASGERTALEQEAVFLGCAEELLDVAQCCFTMMYILAEQYKVDVQTLTRQHIDKLRQKGYWS